MTIDRFTRRGVLKATGAVGVAGIGASANASLLERPAAHRIAENDLQSEVGATFRATFNDWTTIDLRLREITPLKASGMRPAALPRREAFVAIFDAPAGIASQDQLMRVTHPKFGSLDLLLQPLADGSGFEAVFN